MFFFASCAFQEPDRWNAIYRKQQQLAAQAKYRLHGSGGSRRGGRAVYRGKRRNMISFLP